jgi:peptide-methionine (R)-S-oxide reductase
MRKIVKSEQYWRNNLSELAFEVTRKSATEKPFINHNFPNSSGQFHCVCCNAELFDSKKKFDSGSGWPSFYDIVSRDAVNQSHDSSHSMSRTEVSCNRCDAHLGHVFPDGPQPTGLRYCINGSALIFSEK